MVPICASVFLYNCHLYNGVTQLLREVPFVQYFVFLACVSITFLHMAIQRHRCDKKLCFVVLFLLIQR